MSKSIKFIASGSCSALGNFASGDIARNVDDALADHLVNEAMCAEYLQAPKAAAPAPAPAPDPIVEPQPAKRGRKASTEHKED